MWLFDLFKMTNAVVYFSRAGSNWVNDNVTNIEIGNTKLLAEYIQKKIGGDLFEIKTKKTYTDEYYKATEEAKEELNSNFFPELLEYPDLNKYDAIYIGHPIWWGTFPMAIAECLRKNNFSGKKIIPFCTHEGSGIANSANDMRTYVPQGDIVNYFEIRGYRCQKIEEDKEIQEEIDKWLKEINQSN